MKGFSRASLSIWLIFCPLGKSFFSWEGLWEREEVALVGFLSWEGSSKGEDGALVGDGGGLLALPGCWFLSVLADEVGIDHGSFNQGPLHATLTIFLLF